MKKLLKMAAAFESSRRKQGLMTDQLIYNAICTPSGDCIYNPFYFRDCIYLLLYCISLKQEGLYTQSLNCQHAYTNSENNLISTRTQLKRTTLTQHIFQITILTSHFHKHYYIVSTSKFTQNLVLEIVNMQCTITKCNHLTHVYCWRHSVNLSCVIHISQPLSFLVVIHASHHVLSKQE